MINYLKTLHENILAEEPDISSYLIPELDLYISYYSQYCNNDEFCNEYLSIPSQYDMRVFHFDTNEHITISWDTDKLNNYALKHKSPLYMTLDEFNNYFQADLSYSSYELHQISHKINSVRKHTYTSILTMAFYPMDSNLIIDGRHRYIEYKKFKSTCRIPVYIFKDIECINSIFLKKDLISYIILYNIRIMYEYRNDTSLFDRLLRLTDII